MKKILFLLFALALGVGISAAFAGDMQPPGYEITITADAVDVMSSEVPVPAIMVNHEVATTNVTYLLQKVSIDVQSGSSGGLAYLCLKAGEKEIQPLNWTCLKDQNQFIDKDQTWCTQEAFCNIQPFALNCNFKFPL